MDPQTPNRADSPGMSTGTNPFEELVTQLMVFFTNPTSDDLVTRALQITPLVDSSDSLTLELAIAEALNRLADAGHLDTAQGPTQEPAQK